MNSIQINISLLFRRWKLTKMAFNLLVSLFQEKVFLIIRLHYHLLKIENSDKANVNSRKKHIPHIEPKKNMKPLQNHKLEFGHWSKEEHQRFLEAIELYGNIWSKVQEYIKTRTCDQIRSHCQKYFDMVKRDALEEIKKSGKPAVFVVHKSYRVCNVSSISSQIPYYCLPNKVKVTQKETDENLSKSCTEEKLYDFCYESSQIQHTSAQNMANENKENQGFNEKFYNEIAPYYDEIIQPAIINLTEKYEDNNKSWINIDKIQDNEPYNLSFDSEEKESETIEKKTDGLLPKVRYGDDYFEANLSTHFN